MNYYLGFRTASLCRRHFSRPNMCLCRFCVESAHSTQSEHSTQHTVSTQSEHSIQHTVSTRYVQSHTVCTQFAHSLHTVSKICTQSAHSQHRVTQSQHTVCTQSAHSLHTVCTQSAHSHTQSAIKLNTKFSPKKLSSTFLFHTKIYN
jgi:hypothetical protein